MIVRSLGQQTSFWVAAAAVGHALWTSAAPAMTYPLYAAQWDLTPAMTTAIFAIYPIVIVGVLTCFGDISDHIGRRAAILSGLAASMFGVLLFAVAPTVYWVFVGRIFMGIGVGLSAGPATAAMVEFGDVSQPERTSSVTTGAQAVGLASAMLVGGGLIEYAPFPMRLNFGALFVVLSLLFFSAWFLPRHLPMEHPRRWRMKSVSVPREIRGIFLTSVTAVASAYVLGVMMLSVGAQTAHDLIGSKNAFLNGAAISVFAIVWAFSGIVTRRLQSRPAIVLGGSASSIGMALLILSAAWHALPIFLAATVAAGLGYSLLFQGGLKLINAHASPDQRGETLSALYLIAYFMQGGVALIVGLTATVWGFAVGIDTGATTIAMMSTAAIALAVRNLGAFALGPGRL